MDWLTRLLARTRRETDGIEPTLDRRLTHLAASAGLPMHRHVALFRRLR